MKVQTIFDNALKARRADVMINSPQLTLGELVLKLEFVKDKKLPVYFDNIKYRPTGLDSWRGSYRELALRYEGGGNCYEQPKDDCEKDEFGNHHWKCHCGGTKEHSTALPEEPNADDLLRVLKLVQGKYCVGYKGGDFTMGKTTPIWVANYGSSEGFKRDDEKYQGVVDIVERKDKTIIKTGLVES